MTNLMRLECLTSYYNGQLLFSSSNKLLFSSSSNEIEFKTNLEIHTERIIYFKSKYEIPFFKLKTTLLTVDKQ